MNRSPAATGDRSVRIDQDLYGRAILHSRFAEDNANGEEQDAQIAHE